MSWNEPQPHHSESQYVGHHLQAEGELGAEGQGLESSDVPGGYSTSFGPRPAPGLLGPVAASGRTAASSRGPAEDGGGGDGGDRGTEVPETSKGFVSPRNTQFPGQAGEGMAQSRRPGWAQGALDPYLCPAAKWSWARREGGGQVAAAKQPGDMPEVTSRAQGTEKESRRDRETVKSPDRKRLLMGATLP